MKRSCRPIFEREILLRGFVSTFHKHRLYKRKKKEGLGYLRKKKTEILLAISLYRVLDKKFDIRLASFKELIFLCIANWNMARVNFKWTTRRRSISPDRKKKLQLPFDYIPYSQLASID